MKYPIPMPRPQMPMQAQVLPQQMPQQAQRPTMMQRLGNNSDAFLALGAGLLGGRTGAEQFAMGAQGFAQAGKDRRSQQAQSAQQNKTLEFLRQRDPELAQAVEMGVIDTKTAYTEYMQAQRPKTMESTSAIKEYEFAQKNPEFVEFLQRGALGQAKFGMSPVYMQNEKGETVIGQMTSDGRLVPSQMPDGVTPLSPFDKSFDTARGREQGKVEGQNAANAAGDISSALSTADQIDQLINNPGLDQIFGKFDQYRPSTLMSGEGRDALARYKQLEGKAFLEAYGMLRGGGQITEIEGAKAQAAMARLDRAQDEETAKAALKEFRDAVREGARKLQAAYGTSIIGNDQLAPQAQGGSTNINSLIDQYAD